MTVEAQKSIRILDATLIRELFGTQDRHARMIRKALGVELINRDDNILLTGKPANVSLVEELLSLLIQEKKINGDISSQKVEYFLQQLIQGNSNSVQEFVSEPIYMTAKGKTIKPKTVGQSYYVSVMQEKDLTFGIGPAGTGKTYLAVAMAVKAFGLKEVNKIILTRPAIEAGENLGFLPGDLKEKVDPYLRPLYDSLFDILGYEKFQKYMERGLIEVAPLAYMRGRTLENSFVILDEAQNTTEEQMKMFLTRMGIGSKTVITGDVTQIDLPRGKSSGLVQALEIVKDISEIGRVYLTQQDVVRHSLVQKIINAYENKK
ncbi:phosphate starvation-inducible protein PhoH [Tindallia magadiensis]|uniref:PhoH-like protein n=1 Tax=Tindallia magadiensis TaxID=69895 RepID=A0A1I3B5G6_9FIRM|nr:PhoH family protein [Tindallia magadiensis]SFH57336.1 phosphate starvation-inducible protein PhoH [Tindallia magadiensis]